MVNILEGLSHIRAYSSVTKYLFKLGSSEIHRHASRNYLWIKLKPRITVTKVNFSIILWNLILVRDILIKLGTYVLFKLTYLSFS